MKKSPFLPQVLVILVACIGEKALAASLDFTGFETATEAEILAAQENYAAWDSHEQPIGPNHRTTLLDGKVESKTGGHRIVELATGMNYWDGQQWSPSVSSFAEMKNGFFAGRMQYQVHLASNLNTTNAVTVRTPEGIVLNSTPVALALYDAASGNFGVIAMITNCVGVLIDTNRVLYSDAFDGGVCASVVYTISEGAFHQDVVITGRLDPADYDFPPATTRVQIVTEFYGAPSPDRIRRPLSVEQDPKARSKMVAPDLIDEQLGFGRFVMSLGRACIAPNEANTNGLGAYVAKEFKTVAGATYLFESVPYTAIAAELAKLPPCQPSFGGLHIRKTKGYAGIPRPGKTSPGSRPTLTAKNTLAGGVVIDYVATVGTGSTIFQGDYTYLVASAVTLNGPITIEGGAVFKYKSGASMTLNNSLTCKGGIYRPAIFTAVDDDSVGDTMNGVINSGYNHGFISSLGYADPALSTTASILDFRFFRFCYAKQAIRLFGSNPYTLSHSQFIKCIKGVEIQGCGSCCAVISLSVNNCLFSDVSYPLIASTPTCGTSLTATFTMLNSTMDNASQLAYGTFTPYISVVFQATNSIFANVASLNYSSLSKVGNMNGFFNTSGTKFGSGQLEVFTSPFQTIGAGKHYLTSASGFRDVGTTTTLPTTLRADLNKRTTYPPIVTAQTTLTTDQILTPQAQRDTDTPDLGYHYDPLDYAFGGVYVVGAGITVKSGTAIATFGPVANTVYGLGFGNGSSLTSIGAPTNLNWFVLYSTVMEGDNSPWLRPNNSLTGELNGTTPAPSIFARFSSWSVPVQDSVQFYAPANNGPISFQDCEFHNGKLVTARPTINLNNCLLERIYADLTSLDGNVPSLRNNLFFGGTLNFAPNVTTAFVKDNLFDATAIPNNSAGYTTYDGGYNAFITGKNRLLPTFGTDVVLAAAPSYKAGPLGLYYQTSGAVPTLVDPSLNTTADLVGLYHYTMFTNLVSGVQVKETTSLLDIGYHYVALNSSNLPINTDSDANPDYLEDDNGNGSQSGSETDWQTYNSPNQLVGGNGLRVFTPLK